MSLAGPDRRRGKQMLRFIYFEDGEIYFEECRSYNMNSKFNETKWSKCSKSVN